MYLIDSISTEQVYPDTSDPLQENYYIIVKIQFDQTSTEPRKIKVKDITLTTGPRNDSGEVTLQLADIDKTPVMNVIGTRIVLKFKTDFEHLTLVEGAQFTAMLKEFTDSEYHEETFELQNVDPMIGKGEWNRV